MSKSLKLMVYDNTDVGTQLRRLKKASFLPGDLKPLDFELPVGLSHTWVVGGHLYRWFHGLNDFAGFNNWNTALEWLATYKPHQKIEEIQYWGHGSPGHVWLNGHKLDPTRYQEVLGRIHNRLAYGALVWFRTCSTFGGNAGRRFAKDMSNFLDCRVAGYTHNIGIFQSGLHSLSPGQKPSWPREEGIKYGASYAPEKMMGSGFWKKPNTITCLHSKIPNDW